MDTKNVVKRSQNDVLRKYAHVCVSSHSDERGVHSARINASSYILGWFVKFGGKFNYVW